MSPCPSTTDLNDGARAATPAGGRSRRSLAGVPTRRRSGRGASSGFIDRGRSSWSSRWRRVSEIVLPMTFAAVLAIIFKPLVGTLQRHRLKPSLAAGLIVLGLLALMAGVVVATVRGVTDQADQIGDVADEAIDKAADQTDALGIDQAALEDARSRRSRTPRR